MKTMDDAKFYTMMEQEAHLKTLWKKFNALYNPTPKDAVGIGGELAEYEMAIKYKGRIPRKTNQRGWDFKTLDGTKYEVKHRSVPCSKHTRYTISPTQMEVCDKIILTDLNLITGVLSEVTVTTPELISQNLDWDAHGNVYQVKKNFTSKQTKHLAAGGSQIEDAWHEEQPFCGWSSPAGMISKYI